MYEAVGLKSITERKNIPKLEYFEIGFVNDYLAGEFFRKIEQRCQLSSVRTNCVTGSIPTVCNPGPARLRVK